MFWVPGADISRLTFDEGSWCRYLVIDEALGEVDTSEVYIGIPSRAATPRGPAFWVEIETRLRGAGDEDADFMKLLILSRITGFAAGDSLGDYIVKMYTKKGVGPAVEENRRRYGEIEIITPSADSTWTSNPGVLLQTPAGEYRCTMKKRSAFNEQVIPTGKVKIIKKSKEDYTVWFCDDVPIFHMVKCVIGRIQETETTPRIPGIPATGQKVSKTTAELIGFGFDAKPVVQIPLSR